VQIPLWDWRRTDLDILNARIFVPDCDTIVFTGEVAAGQMKGNLYGKSVDLHAISHFWANEDIKKNLQGFISDIDLVLQGPVLTPVVSGHFLADGIRYKQVFLKDGPAAVNLILIPSKEVFQIKGEVVLNSGVLVVRGVNLKMTKSSVYFQGDVLNPRIDIHAGSRVEDTDVHLSLKGTMDRPELIVTSNPPLSPQAALQMLFTGNSWSTPSASPISSGTSAELADAFFNYSQLNNDEQRIGLKKKLTDKLKLGVEMDQLTPAMPGDSAVYYYRKIEGEMDLSNHLSLNISKQVLPQDRESYTTSQQSQQDEETQIYLQYKKSF
jgi:hypothetical protein